MTGSPSMTCREFVEFVDDYIEQRLPAAVRETFEAHIDRCPPCQCYLRTYRDTVRLTRSICPQSDAPVPGEVPEGLIKAILEARKERG